MVKASDYFVEVSDAWRSSSRGPVTRIECRCFPVHDSNTAFWLVNVDNPGFFGGNLEILVVHDGLEQRPLLGVWLARGKGCCLLRKVISDCGFHHTSVFIQCSTVLLWKWENSWHQSSPPSSWPPILLESSRPSPCQLRCLRVHWILSLPIQHARTSWVHCTWEEYPMLLRELLPSSTQLTSAALSKSAQRGIILFPLVPNWWAKSTPFAGSARRMLKTCTRPKNQWRPRYPQLSGYHLLPSLPTPSHDSRLQKLHPLFHSLASASRPGTRGRVVGEWTPAKDQGSQRPSVAPRRARRGCVGCELINQLCRRIHTWCRREDSPTSLLSFAVKMTVCVWIYTQNTSEDHYYIPLRYIRYSIVLPYCR